MFRTAMMMLCTVWALCTFLRTLPAPDASPGMTAVCSVTESVSPDGADAVHGHGIVIPVRKYTPRSTMPTGIPGIAVRTTAEQPLPADVAADDVLRALHRTNGAERFSVMLHHRLLHTQFERTAANDAMIL